MQENNIDVVTVSGFGDEWSRFDQSRLSRSDLEKIFNDYFSIFPWDSLPLNAIGADIGCGSGRWAMFVAPKVGQLFLFDASKEALSVAKKNLYGIPNVNFELASVDSLPLKDATLDFAYSLGVLHHVPDTAAAIRSISKKLKPNAPFLIYIYYSFDNRGIFYSSIWRASDILRRVISRMPYNMRYLFSQVLAFSVYWPLSRIALTLHNLGFDVDGWPLSYYKDKPLYV